MKQVALTVALLLCGLALIVGIAYVARVTSNAITPITLHSPKPGITCATMVTSDGAAIDCWKD